MADIYQSSISSKQTRRKKSSRGREPWLTIADAIVGIVMLILAFATAVCLINPHIAPERMGILSVVALAAPVIYLLDIAVMLYWVVRGRWRMLFGSAIVVIAATTALGKYCRVDLTRNYPTTYNERKCIKVMTYNVANGTAPGIVEYVKEHNPSILCLQEFLFDYNDNWDVLGDKYSTTADGFHDFSCEIMSRYPIIRHGEVDSIRRFNGVWADLRIDEDTVRVINLHLQSTHIRAQDTQFIEEYGYLRDSNRTGRLRSILERLADNNVKRARQARHVREFIERTPYRNIIVCGDFNDVPLSYNYRHIAHSLNNAFTEAGSGYSYTFNGFYRLLTIDYVLVSEPFEVLSYDVDHTAEYSDHYPVTTRLKIKHDNDKK